MAEHFFEFRDVRFHELGFYYLLDSPEVLVGDHSPLERSLENAWFPLERPPSIKPAFLADTLSRPIFPEPPITSITSRQAE